MPESAVRQRDEGQIGLIGAASIGVGGMIGAGIFSILGVVGTSAGSIAWLGFLCSGVLALICAYSFAKLGAVFPSSGGPVEFLLRGFGNNLLSGSLSLMLWLGYILALALYASAFASYSVALIGQSGTVSSQSTSASGWMHSVIAVSVVGFFLVLNIMGAAVVGRAEGLIVAVKLLILLGFVLVVAFSVKPELLGPEHWEPTTSIVTGIGVTFLAFEGFGLITNAAGDMKDPAKTLPRALYLAVVLTTIVYVAVALVAFGTLTAEEIVKKKEYALAAAAEPMMGNVGFIVMSIAALFSTASAINATLFGGANVSVKAASDRQLPQLLDRTLWQGSSVALYVTAGIVALLAALVPLESIANTGSAAFLLIYAGVCAAHLRLQDQTEGRAWLIWAGIVGCALMFALLLIHLIRSDVPSAIGLSGLIGLSVGSEWVYRRIRGATSARPGIDQRQA